MSDGTGKQCSVCGEVKCYGSFTRRKQSPDGWNPRCKSCRNAYERERMAKRMQDPQLKDQENAKQRRKYWADPAKANARGRSWYEANQEAARASSKRWRDANQDRVKETTRKWRERNPDRISVHNRAYRSKNSERYKSARQERYAANPEPTKVRARNWYLSNLERARATNKAWYLNNQDKVHRSRVKRRLNLELASVGPVDISGLIAACETCYLCSDPLVGEVHVDHVIPLSKGGAHSYGNLKPTHARCNLRKSDLLLHDLGWYSGPTDLGSLRDA